MAILLLAGAQISVLGGGGPGRFDVSPTTVLPGGTVTFWGSDFDPGSTIALVTLTNDTADRITLGFVVLINGSFFRSFSIPPDLPSGRYLTNVVDDASELAVQRNGTLIVPPTDAPWFEFSPIVTFPGGTVWVSGRGFSQTSSSAVVGLADAAGQPISILGTAPLVVGAFTRPFNLPASLNPNQSYSLFVSDNAQNLATNLTGPMTAAWSTQPAVTVGEYPVGAAVSPLRNRIYVPNGFDNTLSVISGITNTVTATISVGNLPCAVGVNRLTDQVYVANLNSGSVSVVDGLSMGVVAEVPVGEYPCAVGVIDWSGRVYVGNYFSDSISVIDGVTNTVLAVIDLEGPPYGLGVNPSTNRVYVATGAINSLTVIDATSNSISAVVPVGKAPDAVGVNPWTNRVYIANYLSDSLTVLDGSSNTVLAVIDVGREPSGVAVNPATNRIYVGNYGSDSVSVIDGTSNLVLGTFAVGVTPDGLALNPFTNRIYSVNSNSNDVSVISGWTPFQK